MARQRRWLPALVGLVWRWLVALLEWAAGPVIVGGALVGAGTVLALKGLGVPVDEAAAKAMKTAKEAAAKAAPAVSKGVAEGASVVGEAIAASGPSVGKRVAAGAEAAGAGIRRAIGHRKPDMEKAVSPHARRQLYEVQQGRCNGCGNDYQPKDLTLDHIKPGSKGGSNETDNLQLLCHNCQQHQGQQVNGLPARPPERDPTGQQRAPVGNNNSTTPLTPAALRWPPVRR